MLEAHAKEQNVSITRLHNFERHIVVDFNVQCIFCFNLTFYLRFL